MTKQQRPEPQIEARLEILEDDEDLPRPPLKLSAEEIADREADKAGLAAELKSRVVARDLGVLGNVADDDDGTFEHLDPRARRAGSRRESADVAERSAVEPVIASSPSRALQAANEAVEDADAELVQLDRELAAERKKQLEETQRRSAEHQARLDAIRRKRAAAQEEANQLRLEQDRVSLAARTEAAKEYSRRQRVAEQAGVAERSEALRRRVQPSLDAVRAASRELRALLRAHEPSLTALMAMNHTSMPQDWNYDIKIAFNRVCADAQTLRRDLNHAADSYTTKIPVLERLIAVGWSPALDHAQNVNSTLRYYDPETVSGVLDDLRRQLAKLSSRLSEFDLGPAPTEPAVWAERERERSGSRSALVTPTDTLMPAGGADPVQTHAEGV